MHRELFENEFVMIRHDQSQNIMLIEWKDKCGNLMETKYQEIASDIQRHIRAKAPDRLLADMSKCQYYLTADMGSWFDTPLFSFYTNLPIKRLALVVPDKIFTLAAFDAYRAHESLYPQVELQYFRDLGKAWEWVRG